MKAFLVCITVCAVLLGGCASSSMRSTSIFEFEEMIDIEISTFSTRPNPADEIARARTDILNKGNLLQNNIETSLSPFRSSVGRAKDNLILYGALIGLTSTITTVLVLANKPEDTKIAYGTGGAIITAILGGSQILAGARKDEEAYVKACDDAIYIWTKSDKEPDYTITDRFGRESDAYKRTKLAYSQFSEEAIKVRNNFPNIPEIFTIPNGNQLS